VSPPHRRAKSGIHVDQLELSPQPNTLIGESEVLIFRPAVFAMPEDPTSRLQFAGQVDRVFGDGCAAAHFDAVTAVMLTAATDFSALAISGALEHSRPRWSRSAGTGIVRAHRLLPP
jgi:hypothetical protein